MRAKWRKIIWGLLTLQLFFVQGWCIEKLYYLDSFVNRVVNHFSMPYVFSIYWKWLVVGGWLFVALLILLKHFIQYFAFRKNCILTMELVTDESIKEHFRECVIETELKDVFLGSTQVLYCSEEISSPFVLGFHRPVLLIPKREFDEIQIHLILLHECCHMKNLDTWYKWYLLLVQSILWFQPLAYLFKYFGFLDVEVACDEEVVSGKELGERSAYGQVLLDSLHWSLTKEQTYSAYFYDSKSIMKARLNAIMEMEKKWDKLAIIAIMFLVAETVGIAWQGGTLLLSRHTAIEQNGNIYDGYHIPESFTQTAVERMLALRPRGLNDYYAEFMGEDQYPELEYDSIPDEAVGPWQVRLKDADRYNESIALLLSRYFFYFEDQEKGSEWNPEVGGYLNAECVNERLLAGDKKDAVFRVIVKEYVGEDYASLKAYQDGWANVVKEDGNYYAYYDLAVQIRMVKDYVFELVGVTNGSKTLAAFKEKYPGNYFDDVAEMDLKNEVTDPSKEVATQEETGENHLKQIRIADDQLQVSEEGENWTQIPISLTELLDRGDQMDGVLSNVQEGSFQADTHKLIFAYGGSTNIPAKVTYFDDLEKAWKTVLVSGDYTSVRRFFVSFPEDSQKGYLVLTFDRAMWQEASILFTTEDGGVTWNDMGSIGQMSAGSGHSLTTGMCFITDQVGFLTIRDSETPNIWRTEDAGVTWTKIELTEVPEYYCMAYPPEVIDSKLRLYVGMEETSEDGGTKAVYESDDYGISWSYTGLAVRK